MSWAKEQLEKGALAHAEGKFACPGHFEDSDLASLAKEHRTDIPCSYCGRAKAAPLEVVVSRINDCVSLFYTDAANVLPYDGREGGYQGSTYDTRDLLEGSIGLDIRDDDHRESLIEDIVASMDDVPWAERSMIQPSDSLVASWEGCCQKLLHGVRYFISSASERSIEDAFDEILSPPEILRQVTTLCEKTGLIRSLPTGTRIFRAREQPDGQTFRTPLSLGPPPPRLVPSGRMNAAGIPVFYGALEKQTALLETAAVPCTLAVGSFRTLRPLRIVDLTKVPAVPGFFSDRARQRESIKFLHDFVKDIAKPLQRDAKVHFEYVPSQVITEYFRYQFRPGGDPIEGILYPSARHLGGSSIALFCTRSNLKLSAGDRREILPEEEEISGDAPWLKLNRTTWTSVQLQPVFADVASNPKDKK